MFVFCLFTNKNNAEEEAHSCSQEQLAFSLFYCCSVTECQRSWMVVYPAENSLISAGPFEMSSQFHPHTRQVWRGLDERFSRCANHRHILQILRSCLWHHGPGGTLFCFIVLLYHVYINEMTIKDTWQRFLASLAIVFMFSKESEYFFHHCLIDLFNCSVNRLPA